MYFRESLRLEPRDPRPFDDVIQPWQSVDFAALDPAWINLASGAEARLLERGSDADSPERDDRGANLEPRSSSRASLQRAWIERPRGHSKTCDMAVQLAWILLHAGHPLRGLVAACDREQARYVFDALARIAAANDWIGGDLVFRRDEVRHRENGCLVEVLSSDVNSSFGALPDFVVCDELCHWPRPELWHSLVSSAAKRPGSVLTVLTNAGAGRGWQWEARETARTSDAWYFSSLNGTRAPWISPSHLAEQRTLLPPAVYGRLWDNVWQHSDGGFVTLAEAEACRDDALLRREEGEPHLGYVAAIDYAEKHDFTVGVVAHHDGRRIVVDRMDVAVPTPDRPTPVAWVERWIEEVARGFRHVTFVVDPYQMVGTIQRYETLLPVQRFDFASGRGNHELATTLRRHLLHREIAWYPGCGAIVGLPCNPPRAPRALETRGARGGLHGSPTTPRDDRGGRDDLETELASLLLRESSTGRLRLDHHRDGLHHDDRAFTLGVACLHLAKDRRPAEWLEVTGPRGAGFAW